jgi:hypothetical protein
MDPIAFRLPGRAYRPDASFRGAFKGGERLVLLAQSNSISVFRKSLHKISKMPCTVSGIRIASGETVSSYEEARQLLDQLVNMNDGTPWFVERQASTAQQQTTYVVRRREWNDWYKEKSTALRAFAGIAGAAEKLKALQQDKRDAMMLIAQKLGIEMTHGSFGRMEIATVLPLEQSRSLRFNELAKVVAPEAGDLSRLSFQISGSERFDEKKQWRRLYVAERIVQANPEAVRVDLVGEGNDEKTYLRTRSGWETLKEAFASRETLEGIRLEVACHVALFFSPILRNERYQGETRDRISELQQCMKDLADKSSVTRMQFSWAPQQYIAGSSSVTPESEPQVDNAFLDQNPDYEDPTIISSAMRSVPPCQPGSLRASRRSVPKASEGIVGALQTDDEDSDTAYSGTDDSSDEPSDDDATYSLNRVKALSRRLTNLEYESGFDTDAFDDSNNSSEVES